MPMPSLFKYFAFVGAALLAVLSLANFLLDPSTGATQVAATPAQRSLVVQHDPRASKIERWRDEQAALKAAEQTQTGENASTATKSTATKSTVAASPAAPVRTPVAAAATASPAVPPAAPAVQEPAAPASAPVQKAAQKPQAEPAAQPQPVAAVATDMTPIMGAETTDEQAAKAAEHKQKVAKAKARKEKLARERDTARQRTASNMQDQYYYGQRAAVQSPQPFGTHYSSAYAPQPSYGPFGWGRGW